MEKKGLANKKYKKLLACNDCMDYSCDVRGDLRRMKEMGVDHAILQLTEPDLNQLIDTAKQVSKFVK